MADVAKSAQDLLNVIPKYARPGDKLFVGPTDLRKTPYSDAYLYYLLPEYAPGTYYIEMDPGVANAKDSRMPKDLAHSHRSGASPGGNVMIHGLPNDPAQAQLAWDDWTDGCIAVANEAMDAIWSAVDDGTVIVIRP